MEITKEKLINKWKEICTNSFYLNKEENEENLLQNPVILYQSNFFSVKPNKNIEFCVGTESVNDTGTAPEANNIIYFISVIYKGFLLYKKFDISKDEFNELVELHTNADLKYRADQITKYQQLCESEIKGLMSFSFDQESGKMILVEN
jgi:hypothetical protein